MPESKRNVDKKSEMNIKDEGKTTFPDIAAGRSRSTLEFEKPTSQADPLEK